MLKPKKRKERVYLMRATNGGYVVRSETKRRVLTQDAIDGILLVYDPEYNYPCANRVVRLVLDMVYRNNRKKPVISESAKAAIGDLEIKGVQLKQSKLKTDDIQELVNEFGVVAEQQMIDRFVRNEQPTQEEYEQAQAIGRLMLHRWLEKKNC